PQKAARILEAFQSVLLLLGVAVDRPVDARLAQIGRHLHARDGHEPDPRIAHPPRKDFREQLLHLRPDALRPIVGSHSKSSSVRKPSSGSGSFSSGVGSISGFWGNWIFISEMVSISISRFKISAMFPASRAHLSSTSLTKLWSLETAAMPTTARCQMS